MQRGVVCVGVIALLAGVSGASGPADICLDATLPVAMAAPAAGIAAYSAAEPAAEPAVEIKSPRKPEYVALAGHLARKYRVAPEAATLLVGVAFDTAKRVGLDPLLILAVMAVESRFNPIAWSNAGAKGLMQIIPAYHQDKIRIHGGEDVMLQPETNVLLGALILKEYINQTGSLEDGLQTYNGALADTTQQYAQKILAEKERLMQAATDGPRARPARPAPAPATVALAPTEAMTEF